jgi:hypothetical protein
LAELKAKRRVKLALVVAAGKVTDPEGLVVAALPLPSAVRLALPDGGLIFSQRLCLSVSRRNLKFRTMPERQSLPHWRAAKPQKVKLQKRRDVAVPPLSVSSVAPLAGPVLNNFSIF